MIPSCGERMFIDSSCSCDDLDPLAGTLGRDLGLGELGPDLVEFLRRPDPIAASSSAVEDRSLVLGLLLLGRSSRCSSFWSSGLSSPTRMSPFLTRSPWSTRTSRDDRAGTGA